MKHRTYCLFQKGGERNAAHVKAAGAGGCVRFAPMRAEEDYHLQEAKEVLEYPSAPLRISGRRVGVRSYCLAVYLLARLVDWVLKEDLFMRVHTDRGMPYAISDLVQYTDLAVSTQNRQNFCP